MGEGERLTATSDREVTAFVSDPEAVYSFIGRFVHALRHAGVEHVVISPGSRSTPLSVVARRVEGLRTWVELDERAAAFFALGLAKRSGRPAVLVCTSGTAAANYLPAVVEAHYSRVPMILATADRPPERRDWGAGQTIDQLGLYSGYSRWSVDVPIPEAGVGARRYAGQLAARAVEVATGTPAGAVHLNWPLREPLAPTAQVLAAISVDPPRAEMGPRFTSARTMADPEDVRELVRLARGVERGVICCGPSEMSPAFRAALQAFSDAAGWPILADPISNLRSEVEPGRAPILDCGDVLMRATKWSERMQPELVLRVGETPVSKAQRLWIEQANPSEVLWLDEGGQWGEPSHLATRVIRGAASSLLASAAGELCGQAFQSAPTEAAPSPSPYRSRAWCRAFEAANERARRALDEVVAGREGWSGVAVAATLGRVAPAGATLVSSNSMSIRLLDLAMPNRQEPLRLLCNRGASGIDGVTSTALGAAAAAAAALDGPALLLTGDLAFLHDASGLLLARREAIPLTIVVLDDNGGGIFSFLPIAAQGEDVAFRELFHTPHDLDLERAAAFFELDYCKVREIGELEDAIARGVGRAGVSIIHVPLDPRQNEARFRHAVARACEAVTSEVAA